MRTIELLICFEGERRICYEKKRNIGKAERKGEIIVYSTIDSKRRSRERQERHLVERPYFEAYLEELEMEAFSRRLS